jgi:hypothetical protein
MCGMRLQDRHYHEPNEAFHLLVGDKIDLSVTIDL